MSGLTENHKHVRRRLEPLKLAVTPPEVSQVHGPRTRASVVEAFGVRYHGGTLFDAGMDWSCGGKRPYLANRFVEECVRLSQLRHPNLAMLYGIVMDGPSLTLVTELPASCLDECLGRYEAVPDFMKNSILLDAARGLLYLHKQRPPIAHTRISTKSIYLSSSMSARIGDVGVAGALAAEDAARTSTNERMPPQTFVKILETGTRCTDVQVDIPAFGNVVVHTVCQQRWADPPGHTAVSAYIHTIPGHHSLYPLAYHCLLGGMQPYTQKQVPHVDMDYIVQYLQHTVRNNPPPFPNTLELFQTLVAVEKQLHNNPTSPQHINTHTVQENHLEDAHNSLPYKKCNELARQSDQPSIPSGISHPLTVSTKSTGNTLHFPPPSDSDPQNLAPPTQSEGQYCNSSRRNSTGQVRAPPPKPPQRSSSFRRKSSEQVLSQHTEESFQRAGSLRIKKSSPPPAEQASSTQLHAVPIIKTAGAVFGGGTKQNSLLLPSKFSPRDDLKTSSRSPRSEQYADHRILPPASSSHPTPLLPQTTKHPPPVVSSSLEFERLLARQREKVEADQVKVPTTSLNGTGTHPLEERRAATDLDIPKKLAPKPPRRTSSFRSSQKPTKYEGYSSHTPEVVFRRHLHATQNETASSYSTSPSTGQTRSSLAEYQLRRLSGADLSENHF